MTAQLGTVLGGTYKLERLIGEGGMGSVYEATHLRVPRRFAIKLLNPDVIGNKEVFERFRREAELTSSLGHENIVNVFDFNHTDDNIPYMVLELLQGEDLSSRIRSRGRLPLDQATRLLEQIASALETAHQAGIVHRDLKPQNIFLCKRGSRDDLVKILDFGISKVIHAPSHGTRTGLIMGTPNYMSPEQAEGRQSEIDARTDLFALATIMYEVLTGKMVFDAPTPVGTIYQVCHGVPDPIRAYAPEVPETVERVLLHAMNKRREDRYQSVGTFCQDFMRAVSGTERPTVLTHNSQHMSAQMATVAVNTGHGPSSQPPGSYPPASRPPMTHPPVTPRPSTLSGAASEMQQPVSVVQYVQVPAKKSNAALFALIAVLVVGGGVGAFFALNGKKGEAQPANQPLAVNDPQTDPQGNQPVETKPVETKPETPPVETKPVETKPETPPVETKPVEPAPPPMVELSLKISPSDASVEVDGLAVKDNPIKLPKSDVLVKIVVSKSGYVSETRTVKPLLDGELKVTLKKESKPKVKRNIGPREEDLD